MPLLNLMVEGLLCPTCDCYMINSQDVFAHLMIHLARLENEDDYSA